MTVYLVIDERGGQCGLPLFFACFFAREAAVEFIVSGRREFWQARGYNPSIYEYVRGAEVIPDAFLTNASVGAAK
jgi:hypothetical protein